MKAHGSLSRGMLSISGLVELSLDLIEHYSIASYVLRKVLS
jgi:hypothetical protein